MKRIIVLIFLLAVELCAQNKNSYDIIKGKPNDYKNFLAKSLVDYNQLTNTRLSATLLPEGYYTIGTTNGNSESTFDDNCAITFGHPYAKTSYPVFNYDGIWYKLDEFFTNSQISVQKRTDTLALNANKPGVINFSFTIVISDSTVRFKQTVKNLDGLSHKTALGLFVDPALGEWGDGVLEYDGVNRTTGIILNSSDLPTKLTLWEKANGAKGIGVNINFISEKPEKFIAANWNEMYVSPSPLTSSFSSIYDLDLAMYWPEKILNTGEHNSCEYSISLTPPHFSNELFLRWDIPSTLSIDNGIIFLGTFNSYLEISKAATSSLSSANIELTVPSFLSNTNSVSGISLTSATTNSKISLTTKIKYEDKVEEIVAKVLSGGVVVDEIHKKIFMPATPVSDTGLVVSIDSLVSSEFPTVGVLFHAKQKASDYIITSLTHENIFLYENGNRINNISLEKDTTGGVNSADIVFVLDVTGSMGNQINQVKNNIVEFADSLTKRGIDYRLGMVTFLDVVENKYTFTSDVTQFHQTVSQQYAHGGDDLPENSLQALLDASKYPFRNNCKRIIIWITDASYHESDSFTSLTKTQVINALLSAGVIVHAIGTQDFKSTFYDPIINPTGGNYYNIYGNFKDILLSITRFNSSGKYLLKYLSSETSMPAQIKLQIKYAGLGGEATANFTKSQTMVDKKILSFYPNPFNPTITFKVNMQKFVSGNILIYNLLGQLVKTIPLNRNSGNNITWNARNEIGCPISTGLYIVHLMLKDESEKKYNEFAKILYLK